MPALIVLACTVALIYGLTPERPGVHHVMLALLGGLCLILQFGLLMLGAL